MIGLAWLSLLAAVGMLVFGVFTEDGLMWVYVSIGASALAMILLFAGVVRRKPVQPATAGAPYGPPVGTPEARGRGTAAKAATAPASAPAQRRPATPAPTTAPARKPAAKKTVAKKTTAKKPAAKTAAKKTTAKKTSAASSSSRGTVVAIPERGTYHTAECRYVQGRTDTEKLKAATAKSRGFKACGVCKP
ncbi:MAG: hypothetical protein ACRDH9_00495 [Actinomycetota bacterium]